MSFTLETSKTGKDVIIFNNFKYRESYTVKNGDIIWKCLGKNCKASVTTNCEKTGIFSSKQCHTGPHPVTLRSLTSSSPLPKHCHLTTPRHEENTPDTPHASFSTPVSVNSVTIPPTIQSQGKNDNSITDIQRENMALKEELTKLRSEMKIILDHSIESDQRLLQYTEEVFPNPHSVSVTGTINLDSSSALNVETQTDDNDYDLDRANYKIKQLQNELERLSQPCNMCAILKEEVGNMINSIRCLEAENIMLKDTHPKMQNMPNLLKQTDLSQPTPICNIENEKGVAEDNEGFTTVRKKKRRYEQKESNNMHKAQRSSDKQNVSHFNQNGTIRIPFNNVTVIGDSHARNLSKLIRNKVEESISVSGVCKPGACLLNMKTTDSPAQGHCYVLIAGSNDVDAGREDILFDHLEEVLDTFSMSSAVLVVPLTRRYDLTADSKVHQTIKRVNTFLAKLCQRNKNMEMIDIKNIGRQHYTSHGLHLRNRGKRALAGLIVRRLSSFQVGHHLRETQAEEADVTTFPQRLPSIMVQDNHSTIDVQVLPPLLPSPVKTAAAHQGPTHPTAPHISCQLGTSVCQTVPGPHTFAETLRRSPTTKTFNNINTPKNIYGLPAMKIG